MNCPSKNGQYQKRASYGRIKETTIEGFVMTREYRHIQEHEKEIIELKAKGFTLQEIGDLLGFTRKQIRNFITTYNRRQRKLAAGIPLKHKGRPPKDYVAGEQDKIAELKYALARKEAIIKKLETENELMRDFLSLTERK